MATVVSFESVGAILVIAFLVVPAATAYLLTKDLRFMVLFIVLQGLLSAVGGYFVSDLLEASISGSMAVVSFFCLYFLYSTKEKRAKVPTLTLTHLTQKHVR